MSLKREKFLYAIPGLNMKFLYKSGDQTGHSGLNELCLPELFMITQLVEL